MKWIKTEDQKPPAYKDVLFYKKGIGYVASEAGEWNGDDTFVVPLRNGRNVPVEDFDYWCLIDNPIK